MKLPSGRVFHSRGEKEVYINHASELALHFKAWESDFTVRLRAFDDGMAFRYEIGHTGRESFLVNRETTEFRIPKSCDKLWLQDWVPTYEGPYKERSWDKV